MIYAYLWEFFCRCDIPQPNPIRNARAELPTTTPTVHPKRLRCAVHASFLETTKVARPGREETAKEIRWDTMRYDLEDDLEDGDEDGTYLWTSYWTRNEKAIKRFCSAQRGIIHSESLERICGGTLTICSNISLYHSLSARAHGDLRRQPVWSRDHYTGVKPSHLTLVQANELWRSNPIKSRVRPTSFTATCNNATVGSHTQHLAANITLPSHLLNSVHCQSSHRPSI